MREDEFLCWMQSQGKMKSRPMRDAVSRCKRLERKIDGLNINLDEEYNEDGGASLISMLTYTRADEKMGIPMPGGLVFQPGADPVNGMASLKSAAKKYFEFCLSAPI